MAKTLLQLKNRMLALLDDPTGATYSAALQLEAAQAAVRQIVEYYPKLARTDVTTITGTGPYLAALPTGVLSVDAVLDIENKKFLPKAGLMAGSYRGADIETNDWHLHTAGSLSFSDDPTDGVTIFWRGLYTEPTLDTDILETPDFCFNMLAYFGCSEICVAKGTKAGNIGQYDVKVDSGNPEHNPMLQLSKRFLHMYHQAAKLLPDLEKPSVIG